MNNHICFQNNLYMKKILFIVLVIIFAASCNSHFESEISILLDDDDAKFEKKQELSDCLYCMEGLTICEFTLSSETTKKFCNKKTKTLPQSKDSTWCGYGWFVTPIDAYHVGVFDHLNYFGSGKINDMLLKIRGILTADNVFYSFYIRHFDEDNTDYLEPLEVQIFILNPKENTLYIVESLT